MDCVIIDKPVDYSFFPVAGATPALSSTNKDKDAMRVMQVFGIICAAFALLSFVAALCGAYHQFFIMLISSILSWACLRSDKEDRDQEQDDAKKRAQHYE